MHITGPYPRGGGGGCSALSIPKMSWDGEGDGGACPLNLKATTIKKNDKLYSVFQKLDESESAI